MLETGEVCMVKSIESQDWSLQWSRHRNLESKQLFLCWSLFAHAFFLAAVSSSLIVWVYLHSNFGDGLRNTHMFWNTVRNGPSRSSKVVDFGTNRKHTCDFLLVINGNLGPILPRFRDIAGFLLKTTPSLFHPNFRGVPLGLDCRFCGSEERRP